MTISYVPHTGNQRQYGFHQVSVVYCPEILGNRLGHLSQNGPRAWVLRDFITGLMIHATDSPNGPPSTSPHLLEDIEREVVFSEAPPYYSVENILEWKAYLKLRTMALLSRPPDEGLPEARFGNWQQIQ